MASTPFHDVYVDEAHDQIYIYIETAGSQDKLVKGGVYRVDIAKLLDKGVDTQNFAELDPVLVDGSPVKYEGSATNEHVGISQFSAEDGYLYWCYRAPSAEELLPMRLRTTLHNAVVNTGGQTSMTKPILCTTVVSSASNSAKPNPRLKWLFPASRAMAAFP